MWIEKTQQATYIDMWILIDCAQSEKYVDVWNVFARYASIDGCCAKER